MTIVAAADGSALGNPGPAGWAWYVDEDHWDCGGWTHGTNNMGELTAVLRLLQATAASQEPVRIYCDSTYAINTVTKWMAGWKRRGWRKGDGKAVMNLEIVQALDAAMTGRDVQFVWVKGHAGHELNERADQLANDAARAFQRGKQPASGPGFGDDHADTARLDADEPDLFGELDQVLAVESDEEAVVRLERTLLGDQVRGDRDAVAALLHPDWSEIGRSGRLWTREEMLAEVRPLESQVELEVVRVDRLARDTLLLLWRSHAAGQSAARSSLWVRRGPSSPWLQRFHQGTSL